MYHHDTPTLFGYDTGDLILLLILFLLLRDGSEKAPLAVGTLLLYFFPGTLNAEKIGTFSG